MLMVLKHKKQPGSIWNQAVFIYIRVMRHSLHPAYDSNSRGLSSFVTIVSTAPVSVFES